MLAAPNTVRNRMIASADDQPVCHFSNAARLSVMDTVSVSEPGPPFVNRFTMSNILKFSMPRKDRKSTRLNSSHANISYAVFCLKKKKNNKDKQKTKHSITTHVPLLKRTS